MDSDAIRTLAEKIGKSAGSLSQSEQAQYRRMLGLAAGGLAPRGEVSLDASKQEAFSTVLSCLAALETTGLAWRGRPSFMTEKLLASLQAESLALRTQAEKSDRYFLAAVGPRARDLMESAVLGNFISSAFPKLVHSGNASYIYYEGADSGLDPHIDSDSYSVNMIFVLQHDYQDAPSKLILFKPEGEPDRILLKPGECVLLHGAGTVHAREDLKQDESVTLLTIGFKREA